MPQLDRLACRNKRKPFSLKSRDAQPAWSSTCVISTLLRKLTGTGEIAQTAPCPFRPTLFPLASRWVGRGNPSRARTAHSAPPCSWFLQANLSGFCSARYQDESRPWDSVHVPEPQPESHLRSGSKHCTKNVPRDSCDPTVRPVFCVGREETTMHPSPDQMHFALVAMAVIYVAERIWKLTAKIITFFDKRSVVNKKAFEDKRAKCVPSKTRAKLPIAAGGPLPKNQNTSRRTTLPARNSTQVRPAPLFRCTAFFKSRTQ
jgi:hypothetical protein